jgi:ADP-ribose pyrophosphatase
MTPFEHDLTLPAVEESELVYDQFFKIRKDTLKRPHRKPYTYYTLVPHGPAVIILPFTLEGKVVLSEEYRHPTGKVLLSIPGGYIDHGEDPYEAGQRELLEETGYQAKKYSLMGSAYPYPGISGQILHYVLAEGASKVQEPKLEQSEIVKTVLMDLESLRKRIASGVDVDGNLCTALFWYSQ